MSANEILDTLNAILDAVINVLAVSIQAAGRALLSNVTAAEWFLAAALFGSAWLLSIGRVWRAVGLLAFLATVTACAWLSWKAGRHGVLAQQTVMAAMVLHGLRQSGGRTLAKGGAV